MRVRKDNELAYYVGKWKSVYVALVGLVFLVIGIVFGPEFGAMGEKAQGIASSLLTDVKAPEVTTTIVAPADVSVTTAE